MRNILRPQRKKVTLHLPFYNHPFRMTRFQNPCKSGVAWQRTGPSLWQLLKVPLEFKVLLDIYLGIRSHFCYGDFCICDLLPNMQFPNIRVTCHLMSLLLLIIRRLQLSLSHWSSLHFNSEESILLENTFPLFLKVWEGIKWRYFD